MGRNGLFFYVNFDLTIKGGAKIIEKQNFEIVKAIVSNPSIKGKELERQFGLSRRQLGYRIQKINIWLGASDYPEIERTTGGQFVVNEAVIRFLNIQPSAQETSLYANVDQRVQYMVLMLLSQKDLSLNHFVADLQVSKNTVLNDLKKAKSMLAPYDISINYVRKDGYFLSGTEFNIRLVLIHWLEKCFALHMSQSDMLRALELDMRVINDVTKRIDEMERYLDHQFTDESVQILAFKLALIMKRIHHGDYIEGFAIGYDDLSDTKEYYATEILTAPIVDMPRREKLFVTLQLLSTRVQWYDQHVDHDYRIREAIDQMIHRFEQLTCITIRNPAQLSHHLLLHMKPAFYRIKYDLSDVDALDYNVKSNYKALFHMVKLAAQPLETVLGEALPENEVGYLSMLFGGSLRSQNEDIDRRVKAIVVCTQGTSVSQMLLQDLRILFPEFIFLDALSLRAFPEYDLDFDVVFAPIQVTTTKPLYVIDTILRPHDKHVLRQKVASDFGMAKETQPSVNHLLDIVKQYATIHDEQALCDALTYEMQQTMTSPMSLSVDVVPRAYQLSDFITTERIQIVTRVNSMAEAIERAAQPLRDAQDITAEYVSQMKQAFDPNYMVLYHNIAIPHADAVYGVTRTAMSMLVLREPIILDNGQAIHIVVVIAATDKEQHLSAILQLRALAKQTEDVQEIMTSRYVTSIHDVIVRYENME